MQTIVERFAAAGFASYSQINFGCEKGRVVADFDLIPDAVDQVRVRLFIKTDAEHAEHGLNRQHGIVGDRLPHFVTFLG
jgi:hypothetical protein